MTSSTARRARGGRGAPRDFSLLESRRAWLGRGAGFLAAMGLRGAIGLGGVGAATALQAAQRAVDDLPIVLDLPDDWIPIPRAEIVEATERARTEGAAIDWQMRAAWQRVPHLRWFTLPHLLLESQPAADTGRRAAKLEHSVGRAGSRSVYTHRAVWARDGLTLRLTLLSWEDQRAMFEAWIASLRDGGQPLDMAS